MRWTIVFSGLCLAAQPATAQSNDVDAAQRPKAAVPSPARCDRPENRQFDFWVGHWNVFDTNDKSPQGESRIESMYDGCTVRENWVDPQLKGGSLNTYAWRDHKWHQLWTDSSGAWREYIGGLVGKEMVLIATTPSMRTPGVIVRDKLTFTPNADGSVRQHNTTSMDGIMWRDNYDYTYRRATD